MCFADCLKQFPSENQLKMNKRLIINRVSKLFQPMTALTKNQPVLNEEITSKSLQLMLDNGIIRQSSPGSFNFLPLGVRALEKLTNFINDEMQLLNAQKVVFPTLINAKLWKTSGRYKDATELFKLKDRHDAEYLLSPTHEEVAAEIISSIGQISYKKFPLRVYQITSKFRDEMKPRFGLMRARQFIMKDLYAFDISLGNAQKTYVQMCESYNRIFKLIDVPFECVVGSSGMMGGNLSHEYHYPAEIGEDKLLKCHECNFSANLEYLTEQQAEIKPDQCPKCASSKISITNGIEVGHTFLLGDKYSKPLRCKFLSETGKQEDLQMGSYGLGVSRIIAASLEVLSANSAIRWPKLFAPFSTVLIGPKSGSKEEATLLMKPEDLYFRLNQIDSFTGDILLDDRSEMTIGKRVLEAKRTGYPNVIVIGGKSGQLLELLDVYSGEVMHFSLEQLLDFFQQKNVLTASN